MYDRMRNIGRLMCHDDCTRNRSHRQITVMNRSELDESAHLPEWPERREAGIGVVGAGFIVRDCHLVAYADAGFRVIGITSRTAARAREVASLRGIPRVFDSVEQMLEDP